jgi:hypothetical protein
VRGVEQAHAIDGFDKYTKPSSMMWVGAEDAECWGFMKWSAKDTSNNGIACFKWAMSMKPVEVTAKNADDVLCRANAGTSRTYVSSGRDDQGFSEACRRTCEGVAANPDTPKYAAIDIIMWLRSRQRDSWPWKLVRSSLDRRHAR